jgi:ArsR family metal-binding transcriptional regulator
MSKTIVIMDAPDNAASIEQIGDENPYFLGAFGEVITLLRQAFPEADFSDPTDITVNTNMGKISIEIAKHTPVQNFMLHLDKAEAVELVQRLCEKTKWRALDTDTGLFVDITARNSNSKVGNVNKSWWKPWKK